MRLQGSSSNPWSKFLTSSVLELAWNLTRFFIPEVLTLFLNRVSLSLLLIMSIKMAFLSSCSSPKVHTD